MLPAAIRSDPDARRWGVVVAFYVGKDENHWPINDFVAALKAVQRAEGVAQTASPMRVRRRIDLDNPTPAQAETVWEEGTALRTVAPWISGPLALLAAGHYGEVTGVVGMSRPELSCDRLLRMIDNFEDAFYKSPFDEAIPPDIDPLPAPSQLKTLIDLRIVKGVVDEDGNTVAGGDAAIGFTEREADRLEQRRAARLLWTFPDDVHKAFALGRAAWHKEGRSKPTALHALLKYAAMMSLDSGFSAVDRKSLWRDHMTLWIMSHMSGSVTELGIVQLYRLMANSESSLAKQLRRVLQFGAHGKDPLSRFAKQALKDLESIQINTLVV